MVFDSGSRGLLLFAFCPVMKSFAFFPCLTDAAKGQPQGATSANARLRRACEPQQRAADSGKTTGKMQRRGSGERDLKMPRAHAERMRDQGPRISQGELKDVTGGMATSYVKYCDEFAKNSNRQLSGTESRSHIQN